MGSTSFWAHCALEDSPKLKPDIAAPIVEDSRAAFGDMRGPEGHKQQRGIWYSVYGTWYLVHSIQRQGSCKPWFLEPPLSGALDPRCRSLMFMSCSLCSLRSSTCLPLSGVWSAVPISLHLGPPPDPRSWLVKTHLVLQANCYMLACAM